MKAFLILTAALVILLSFSFPAQSQPQTVFTPQGGPIGWFVAIAYSQTVDYSQPSVVFANNLNTYYVAYRSSNNEIIVTRVLPTGLPNGFFTPAAARDNFSRNAPDLAYDPNTQQMLVVWEEKDPQTGYIDIYGRIANNAGNVYGYDFSICEGVLGAQCYHPAVAYSPVQLRYLVVWQRTSGPEASGNIEGRFVSPNGFTLGPIIPIRESNTTDSFDQPDVAFNHIRNEFLVAFRLVDCRTFPPCQTDILGHRISYLGEVLDQFYGIMIGYNTVPERDPAVAANPDPTGNKCWMIAWTFYYNSTDRDIHHNLLDCDGHPQGGTGWGLASTELDDFDPSITWSESAQKYLAAWTLTTYSDQYLTFTTLAGVELTPSGDPASSFRQIGGLIASDPSVAAGLNSEYLTAFTESMLFGRQEIHARLWGNRVYIPVIKK